MTDEYSVVLDVDDDGRLRALVERTKPASEKRHTYTDPIPENRGLRFCWLRFRRHLWSSQYARGNHRWKTCVDCGRRKMTAHINCHPACWAGPA